MSQSPICPGTVSKSFSVRQVFGHASRSVEALILVDGVLIAALVAIAERKSSAVGKG